MITTKLNGWIERLLALLCEPSDLVNLDSALYMRRFRIIMTRWFGVRIHHIYSSDRERDPHDHPWTFLSIILSGCYEETRVYPSKHQSNIAMLKFSVYIRGSVNFCRAEQLHTVTLRNEKPVWSLVFTGPLRRTWGFQTPAGWMPHTAYRSVKGYAE